MTSLTVGDVLAWMDEWYPPQTAADWDRVGLIVGSRKAPVRRILLAVDPVEQTVDQATDLGVDLMITHHPLYLRGTSFVSEDDAKGRLVTRLIRSGVALFNAHTNADVAHDGVAQALAELLDLLDCEAMEVTGDEGIGYGRVGLLSDTKTLREFADFVASRLPAGPTGLLVGGDLDRIVERVAVSGGSGDSFLGLVAELGVDAYVTADLRHHPASEHLEDEGPALLCGSHWATEWPWLPLLKQRLLDESSYAGHKLDVIVSDTVTEPWSAHFQTEGSTI